MKPLLFGRFVKPFGIKGYIKVIFFSEGLQDIDYFSRFFIKDSRFGWKDFIFEEIISRQDKIVVKCSLATNRDEAELLRSVDIYVDEEELPKADEGEYYIKDLIACEVLNENRHFGHVKDMVEIAGQWLMMIQRDGKKELMVPFKKPYLEKVDNVKHCIYMRRLDELL